MLFKQDVLSLIRTGEVSAAFRRWRRPSEKPGGKLKTSVGLLSIQSVERVEADAITDAEAVEAGYGSAKEVVADLARREGEVYQVRFQRIGPDPRIALRQKAQLITDELREVTLRLERLDKASRAGKWTQDVLSLLDTNDGVRAGDLAPQADQEKEAFKLNVRKLKNLGLTESLEIGYRLSPRGVVVLEKLRASDI